MEKEAQISSTQTASETEKKHRKKKKSKKKIAAIFDFDDTIFCTKYLDTFSLDYSRIFSGAQKVEDLNEKIVNEIRDLETSAMQLMSELLELDASVFIVSNADLRWISNILFFFCPTSTTSSQKTKSKFSQRRICSVRFIRRVKGGRESVLGKL